MAGRGNARVIVKRRRSRPAEPHHGGAWKVAYADFVTAMMAFFMLMWLLNATTEQQRSGIADYFNPTVPINRTSGGGNGAFGGDSVFTEKTLVQHGLGATMRMPTEQNRARGETGAQDTPEPQTDERDARRRLEELEERLIGTGGESMVSERLMRHVVTRQTDEGLIVELFDLPGAPLFRGGSAEPTSTMLELVSQLARVFALVTNEIAVRGHVAASPVVRIPQSPWDLTADRADATRRMLLASEVDEPRIERVEAHADRQPATGDPLAPRNSRVEIVLLRNDEGR